MIWFIYLHWQLLNTLYKLNFFLPLKIPCYKVQKSVGFCWILNIVLPLYIMKHWLNKLKVNAIQRLSIPRRSPGLIFVVCVGFGGWLYLLIPDILDISRSFQTLEWIKRKRYLIRYYNVYTVLLYLWFVWLNLYICWMYSLSIREMSYNMCFWYFKFVELQIGL